MNAAREPSVADLMTLEPVSLGPDDTVKALEELLRLKAIRHVPVTDDDGRLVGLVTHRDFLTIAVSKLAGAVRSELDAVYERLRLREIMGRKVRTISPHAPLRDAARILFENKFGCVPVTDHDGRLVGILTEADFVRVFIERDTFLGP